MNKQRLVLAASFLVFALFLGALLILEKQFPVIPDLARNMLWTVVGAAVIIGPLIALGFKKIPTPWGMLDVPPETGPAALPGPPKELSPEVERERRNYSADKEQQLPGFFAPAFQLLDEKLALTVTPCADPIMR